MIYTANINPRETKVAPEDRNATMKRPLRRPSRYPPGPIDFATPYSKHFARPSEAEKVELANGRINNMDDGLMMV